MLDLAGVLMEKLAVAGIRLEMLDIGGGFPARYADPVPDASDFGAVIREGLDRLPYRPWVVAEPGRALVAEAGVLVTTVIGTAERGGRDWVHLDVGAFNGLMEALETGNTLAYPLTDSRRSANGRAQLTGPSCDSQDTIMYDAPLSAGLASATASTSGRRAPIRPPTPPRSTASTCRRSAAWQETNQNPCEFSEPSPGPGAGSIPSEF